MKKNIVAALISMCLLFIFPAPISAFATKNVKSNTPTSWGLKGGLNFATIFAKHAGQNDINTGFSAGLYYNLPISALFSVQPEVLFSQKGLRTTFDADLLGVSIADGQSNFNLNYIDVPLYAVINITEKIDIHAGPYLGVLIGTRITTQAEVLDFLEINDEDDINPEQFERITFGLSAGAGITYNPVTIGINYNLGLSPVAGEDDLAALLINDAENQFIRLFLSVKI